jgi:hypothetical protein
LPGLLSAKTNTLYATASALGPLNLTMPMPPSPTGVAIAAMVSVIRLPLKITLFLDLFVRAKIQMLTY